MKDNVNIFLPSFTRLLSGNIFDSMQYILTVFSLNYNTECDTSCGMKRCSEQMPLSGAKVERMAFMREASQLRDVHFNASLVACPTHELAHTEQLELFSYGNGCKTATHLYEHAY